MTNAMDNPIIMISESDGIYCSHSTDSAGRPYNLTCSDRRPEPMVGRCVTETSLDRSLSTCDCGLFVWKRVPPIELFNAVPPQVMQEVGNHLPMTDKQRRYINVLMDKIQRRHDISDLDFAKAINLPSKTRGEASKKIDFLKVLLGE